MLRNPEKRRAYQRAQYRKHEQREFHRREIIRLQLLARFGSVCCRCGFDDIRALQLDHIHGGGHKERCSMGSGTYYRKILKLSELELHGKFQLLCANCNWIKHLEDISRIKGWGYCAPRPAPPKRGARGAPAHHQPQVSAAARGISPQVGEQE